MKLNFQNTEVAFQAKSNSDLLRSYFIFGLLNNPNLVHLGSMATKVALDLHLPIRPLIRATVFKEFCGGETLRESLQTAMNLYRFGVRSILDVAVEGSQDEKVFEETTEEILRTISLSESRPFLPFSVFKMTGIARFSLLEKIHKKEPLTQEEIKEWADAKARVLKICKAAYDKKVKLLVDAEESWIQDAVDSIAFEMMEKFNKETPIIYNTVQMYRKDRLAYLKAIFEKAKTEKIIFGVKVVRGAYLEKERNRAQELNVPSPLFDTKEETDNAYNQAIDFCMDHLEGLALVAGTHNEFSTQHLIDLMEKKGITPSDERVYFSQLYGMSDHLSFHLARSGYLVAKYLPYGDVRVLMPYLIRRAQENKSIHGQTPRELSMLKKEIDRRKQAPTRQSLSSS